MFRSLVAAMTALGVFALAGCPGRAPASCDTDATVACTCANGASGVRACVPDSGTSVCVCDLVIDVIDTTDATADSVDESAVTCTPPAMRTCFSGPASTLGVGRCIAGTQSCDASNRLWGACVGEVTPAARETCGNGLDDNCDGTIDEGCAAPTLLPRTDALASHTCVILPDGTIQCAGRNDYGQIGIGVTSPTVTRPQPVLEIHGATAVALGKQGTCAVLADHTLSCWGRNDHQELLGGGPSVLLHPTLIPGVSAATQVVLGQAHTCVLRIDHTVQCWGVNTFGQVGDGTTALQLAPTVVPGLGGVTQIAAGTDHTCALLDDATVRCWGHDDQGQIGPACTTTSCLTPTEITGLTGVHQISVGGQFTCALRTDGTVWCWGVNNASQLGQPGGASMASPQLVTGLAGETAVEIGVGINNGCARVASGGVRCWGANILGSVGDGSMDFIVPSARAAMLTVPVASLSVGTFHRFAMGTDGMLYGWGGNSDGELGDGTLNSRLVPGVIAAW